MFTCYFIKSPSWTLFVFHDKTHGSYCMMKIIKPSDQYFKSEPMTQTCAENWHNLGASNSLGSGLRLYVMLPRGDKDKKRRRNATEE